jgi:hypothetical protein
MFALIDKNVFGLWLRSAGLDFEQKIFAPLFFMGFDIQ